MSESYFFFNVEKNAKNGAAIDAFKNFSEEHSLQMFVLNKPLGDSKFSYDYEEALVVLIPGRKLIFIDYGNNQLRFDSFVDDFIDDLGYLSDKYKYKNEIGRPRQWRGRLTCETGCNFLKSINVLSIFQRSEISDQKDKRLSELIISLLTGSINDIDRVKLEVPKTILDKVKQKIILFDGDQTRFIYENDIKNVIKIQGLSGTGKTELLLHKLKELYVNNENARIAFTCHNRILADTLKRRIPEFFNFMKVEQQIDWEDRLRCVHAWGWSADINSGIYRMACHEYGLNYRSWVRGLTFDRVCREAVQELKRKPEIVPIFDYMLIDESQDFTDSFIEFCQMITSKKIYIAGDIFQSIFDRAFRESVTPDYLLSKCYRTNPKTLMFAHGLGMGLFEDVPLRWLSDEEWVACGYQLEKENAGKVYHLTREPLRVFEEPDVVDFDSVEIIKVDKADQDTIFSNIVELVNKIKIENPTAGPEDIGIIFIDGSKLDYSVCDLLEFNALPAIGWKVNKAYETKRKDKNALMISNKNNVKGLEFPFVICVTNFITRDYSYRNALYTMLSRSFLKTYLLVAGNHKSEILKKWEKGLSYILRGGYMEVQLPGEDVRESLRTKINFEEDNLTLYDRVEKILIEAQIMQVLWTKIQDMARVAFSDARPNQDTLEEFVHHNAKTLSGE